MPGLNIIEPPVRRTSGRQSAAMLLRCLLVLFIAVAIRIAAEQRSNSQDAQSSAVQLADVQSLLPAADTLRPASDGMQAILSSKGEPLGYAITTQPAAVDVVGYRGPSNVLLILDEDSSVTEAKLLSSEDTPEHVAAIANDNTFLLQFRGWAQGNVSTFGSVDATTGATLTSLAIAEGIAVRMGSEKPSLRFPDDFEANDLALLFDNPESLRIRPINILEAEVLNESNVVVSRIVRTGPLVDSVPGYQGPSELILAVDNDAKIEELALRRTWDNQPYAGYLNDDKWFWKVFRSQTLKQLQEFDPQAEQVEGVSGATMTSLAVADTLVAAAKAHFERQIEAQQPKPTPSPIVRWGMHDWGTLLVVCMGFLIGMTRLRGRRLVRNFWNFALGAYFGLVTGNLISLAVVMGWAAKGIAWKLAPGLAIVILFSLLMPPITRRNIYCSHLCPHGAAQQLLKNRWRTEWRISAKWSKRLRWCPGILLVTATLATVFGRTWNLAAWEPFNAYVWYIAGFGSLTLAIGSLLVSAVIPMAYCRYGCATGRLLEYLRRSAAAAKFSFADGCAVLIATAAWLNVYRGW